MVSAALFIEGLNGFLPSPAILAKAGILNNKMTKNKLQSIPWQANGTGMSECFIIADQCAGNTVPNSTGLTAVTTTVNVYLNARFIEHLSQLERLTHEHSENRIKELKKDFAGEVLPSGDFKVNKLYFPQSPDRNP